MLQNAVIHAEYTFTGHNAVINAICYNRHQDCFVTSDDMCLRLWSTSRGELRCVNLPARTSHYIQAIEYLESRQLYVASALDGTIKMYDLQLNELTALFTGQGNIMTMAFDSRHNRLFTGGVDGCAAWLIRGKPLIGNGAESTINPHYELSPLPTFFLPPGATASLYHATKKKNNKSTSSPRRGHDSLPGSRAPHLRPWIQNLYLNSEKTRLYAQSKHSVDVFSAVDGHFIESYTELLTSEQGPIMACVMHEKTQYLVCGCMNGSIYVFSVHPVSIVHVFRDHTASVTSLAVHSSSGLILSSSLDGSIRLWDLEARRQVHRLDIGQPVHALELLVPHANPCRFHCRVRSTVQLFRIQSTIKEHMPCLSPISILQRVLFPSVVHEDAVIATSDHHGIPSTAESTDSATNAAGMLQQVIVAAGVDKTIRLFSGRAANEAPNFTWIPEENALDVIGFALNPVSNHLYLLLESRRMLQVDARQRDKEESSIERIVILDTAPAPIMTGNTSPTRSTGARTPVQHGDIHVICCCYYPPLFRPVMRARRSSHDVTGVTSSIDLGAGSPSAVAQARWAGRTFMRRQSVSLNDSFLPHGQPTHGDSEHPEEPEIVTSEHDWVVAGSELGQLIFWHSGLSNSLQESVSIDAHDAAVIALCASAASPMLVSLDDAHTIHVWQFQPLFTLRHVLTVAERPTCFVLSPTSELLLSGFEDGTVILMDLSDLSDVETYATEDNHSAMICAADFLDEKQLCLTASVDATIKVWDQQKTLLRQVTIAVAFTSLCFMNSSGDVMAGLSSGIFILPRNDVLPDRLPLPNQRKINRRRQKELKQRQEEEQRLKQAAEGPTVLVPGLRAHPGHDRRRVAIAAHGHLDEHSQSFPQHRRVDEAAPDQSDSQQASNQTPEGPSREVSTVAAKKKKQIDEELLQVVNRPVATVQPPVLRPQNHTDVNRMLEIPKPPSESQNLRDDANADWRDTLLPSSTSRPDPSFSLRPRRKPRLPSSPVHLQSLSNNARTSSPRTARLNHATTTTEMTSLMPTPPGVSDASSGYTSLGFNNATTSPIQYCKHQAPVPPKQKTPRKLWNAIGGEDRRLIVLQRNLPPVT
ncbi:TPA: hypothetical protein N0F65_003181 [Lagenidium giganteum]|uniref:Uncharacterized protein n=1 Tax=Lagenidium giganteum TaxID=4803 RepID=A0AAV2Z7P4_9STRA|nr:TPA: hypothetical protein N0F65_003181 [Lagenidium giganteum]